MFALSLELFEKKEKLQHGVSTRYMPIHHTFLMDTLNMQFSDEVPKGGFHDFISFSFSAAIINMYCVY
jgi:hypothetical protein